MIESLNTNSPIYMGAERRLIEGSVCMFGVPFDATVSFRPGTRFGADAIRSVSDGLETYCPVLDRDLEDAPYCDLGNVEFTASPEEVGKGITGVVREIVEAGCRPLMLGGEHSLTPHAVRAVYETYPNLLLIQMDAHAELRDGYNGQVFSHASAMRRCLDFLPAAQLIQFGIRSGTREEFAEMRAARRLVGDALQLAEALKAHAHRPVYLTIDLDVFDPSLFPGTGTPEYGGIDWPEFMRVLDVLSSHKIVAADAVELAPQLDPTGCSSILASKVVRELLLTMR